MQTRGLKLSAVLVGLFVDIGGTFVSWAILSTLISLPLVSGGIPAADLEQAILEALLTPKWLGIGFLLGFSFTALGGHVAARMGRHEPMKHALALGIASLVTAAMMQLGEAAGSLTTPLWYDLLGYVVTVPAALLGGCLVERRSAAGLEAAAPSPTPIR